MKEDVHTILSYDILYCPVLYCTRISYHICLKLNSMSFGPLPIGQLQELEGVRGLKAGCQAVGEAQ